MGNSTMGINTTISSQFSNEPTSFISNILTNIDIKTLFYAGAAVFVAGCAINYMRTRKPAEAIEKISGTNYWAMTKTRDEFLNAKIDKYLAHKTKPGAVLNVHLYQYPDGSFQLLLAFHHRNQMDAFLDQHNIPQSNSQSMLRPDGSVNGLVMLQRTSNKAFYKDIIDRLVSFDPTVADIRPTLSKTFMNTNAFKHEQLLFKMKRLGIEIEEATARYEIEKDAMIRL